MLLYSEDFVWSRRRTACLLQDLAWSEVWSATGILVTGTRADMDGFRKRKPPLWSENQSTTFKHLPRLSSRREKSGFRDNRPTEQGSVLRSAQKGAFIFFAVKSEFSSANVGKGSPRPQACLLVSHSLLVFRLPSPFILLVTSASVASRSVKALALALL